jgi:hypothetical protein
LIVDNDDAGNEVVKAAKKVNKAASAETFFHIRDNLYLVKTPPVADGGKSSIEDCFPAEILSRKLDGSKRCAGVTYPCGCGSVKVASDGARSF